MREVTVGQVYRHFKGGLYLVEGIGAHTETKEEQVVYVNYPDRAHVWIRPYDMFISEVDHEKYPEVKQKYRFELVEDYQIEFVPLRHGYWEQMPSNGIGGTGKCSRCGESIYGYMAMRYCPNCGALMEGGVI